ncbi:MAG: MFS transporter, partial [Gemmatimonadota bacterium]|nr:MFS transporter [Gemmatimonadota bacterium]
MSTSKTDQKAAPWGEGEPIGRDYPPIPLLEKIAYGVGVLPMNTSVNSIKKLSGPIFNITLGMHPSKVGTVLLLSRGWDAITDPFMGWLSDNTKSRWGRRRPYLLLGAILTAIGYALILNVPQGLSQDALYAYFMFASLG